jgi:hypothetical protein
MTKIEGIPIERFNGANIDELYTRQLPDRIDHNLDLVIVNKNRFNFKTIK